MSRVGTHQDPFPQALPPTSSQASHRLQGKCRWASGRFYFIQIHFRFISILFKFSSDLFKFISILFNSFQLYARTYVRMHAFLYTFIPAYMFCWFQYLYFFFSILFLLIFYYLNQSSDNKYMRICERLRMSWIIHDIFYLLKWIFAFQSDINDN